MWKNNGGHNGKSECWWVGSKGYIEGRILLPDGTRRRVRRHRLEMERLIGRKLLPSEDVHHIDGDKTNNDIHNLRLIHHGEHTKHHNLNRQYKKGYTMNLTDAERKNRRERAIAMGLAGIGRAAIAKATGGKE